MTYGLMIRAIKISPRIGVAQAAREDRAIAGDDSSCAIGAGLHRALEFAGAIFVDEKGKAKGNALSSSSADFQD